MIRNDLKQIEKRVETGNNKQNNIAAGVAQASWLHSLENNHDYVAGACVNFTVQIAWLAIFCDSVLTKKSAENTSHRDQSKDVETWSNWNIKSGNAINSWSIFLFAQLNHYIIDWHVVRLKHELKNSESHVGVKRLIWLVPFRLSSFKAKVINEQ